MTSVPFIDLTFESSIIRKKLESRFKTILDNNDFVLGREVKEFEEKACKFLDTPYALACASGSDALLLALMAFDIKTPHSVITTSFSFFATAGSILRCGANPIFLDIEPDTLDLSINRLVQFLESNCIREGETTLLKKARTPVSACLPVHIFGRGMNMEPLMHIVREWNLLVIEDAAQAFSSKCKFANGTMKNCGTIGNAGCYSFYPTKNLGAMGDAGLVVTGDEKIYKKMLALRNHGMAPRNYHHFFGTNSRMDSFQGAVLNLKLKFLQDWDEKRKTNAAIYFKNLKNTAAVKDGFLRLLPEATFPEAHCYHQFVVLCKKRDELKNYLMEKGIGTAIFYPLSIPMQPCFESHNFKESDFPTSIKTTQECLALPIGPGLNESQIRYVCDEIVEFYKKLM
ncbi:DegT/DnrJ/EryC1/StrS family aminotransferase [Candidatus Riflebacteria bacterium]